MREDGTTQSHPPGVLKRKQTLKDQDYESVGSCFVKIVTYYRAEEGDDGNRSPAWEDSEGRQVFELGSNR